MKHYYIRHPRNFTNEYKLVWIESTDTESIARACEEGYSRITRKEAYRTVSGEKYARKNDQAFSGYGDAIILPYKATELPALPECDYWEEYFELCGTRAGTLRFACQTQKNIAVNLHSDDGILFE